MAETKELDLTQLSTAALEAWLGECERYTTLDSWFGKRMNALVRYVRTLNGAFGRQLAEAGTLRKERAALAARVAELENALRSARPHDGHHEGSCPCAHDTGDVGCRCTAGRNRKTIDAALAGGKERK